MHIFLPKNFGVLKENPTFARTKIALLMRKSLLALTLALSLSVPVLALPFMMDPNVVAQMDQDVTITVEGNAVLVKGAEGQTLEVISLTGRKLAEYRIESPAQRVELNLSRGCYVLKIGKVVRKVSIR